ncbi:MAG: NAD(P)H-hydrate dehydratase [Lentisphaeraceae bacterium]|nr:NAD(P)H-hydrate dehydratase [Lentisphaeraceae bacterium]
MRIISSDTMRSIDNKTISEGHVEGRILMERAGLGASVEIVKFASLLNEKFRQRYVIVCGKGNNGGDGYVIAKDLNERGFKVQILSVCEISELKGDALYHAKKISKDIDFRVIKDGFQFGDGDFIVDCLLGTGLNSDVKEPYKSIIEAINGSGCPIASLDISSGLNGNDGKVFGVAVKADITLTIGLPKTGLFLNEGPSHTGRLKCIEIGFPEEIIAEFEFEGELLCEHELRRFFKRRGHASHKYKCGNVLVVGGSRNYGGAPFLAARASFRSGAGMVSVIYPNCVQSSGPDSLIKIPLESTKDGAFAKKAALELRVHLEKKNVVVIGPGMSGAKDELYLIETVMKSDKIVVADAGAFSHLAANSDLMKREDCTVLTPHSGELDRLLSGTGLKSAAEFAKKFKLFVLVKGQFSKLYTPSGETITNSTGCSSLATAGSGDVLAGIIGAFLSFSDSQLDAISHAVAVHGLCGEYVKNGTFATIADDLIEEIPQVLKGISPYC